MAVLLHLCIALIWTTQTCLFSSGELRCSHGCEPHEQWVCLQCVDVNCGRCVRKHSLEHHLSNPSQVTVTSLADLLTHCYACNTYVEHPRLEPLLARLRLLNLVRAAAAAEG